MRSLFRGDRSERSTPKATAWRATRNAMPNRLPALGALIRSAEAAAARQPDMMKILVTALNVVIPSAAGPYLVTAALIEGIARTVLLKISVAKQGEVSVGHRR